MSMQQAAMSAASADGDLAAIGLTRVPEVWPPLASTELAAVPAAAGSPKPPAQDRPWTHQFAVLLAEAVTGARPVQQILPWLSKRASLQLHRLLPVLRGEHRPRVLRVLTAMPSQDVVELTMVVLIGPRARALAVRLEHTAQPEHTAHPEHTAWRGKLATRWLCTDIEAG
jgi:Family of unknown function (DUF6459)